MDSFNWVCPFCNHATTITESNFYQTAASLTIGNKIGLKRSLTTYIVCPNPECKMFTMTVDLHDGYYVGNNFLTGNLEQHWDLIPSSKAKVFPDYIPKQILDDYKEACLIKNLSPKASATLSRRCLQGIIRDFWGMTKSRLVDEIEAIKDKVDPLTWGAIDAVRKIGNIGAHMEKDINLIIDVEPTEAALLIELIETLFKDWYVTRNERKERLKSIISVSDNKETEKKKAI
jgi:hypothetical protein